jgi:hypothetical protein
VNEKRSRPLQELHVAKLLQTSHILEAI